MYNSLVGIVIVTYNRLQLLKEVVGSIREQTYRDFNIIVVNNGSTDDTLDWLNEQQDIITITQANLGGAGGFYTGMKYVAERHYDFCWVMDDDVITSPTALSELLSAYGKSDNIGFVCSKVIGLQGQPMNTPVVDTRCVDGNYPYYYDLIDYNMIRVVNATFVSVLFPVRVIREVGLPYKEYFIWGDDSEYTTRVSYKRICYLACNSVVTHKRADQKMLDFNTETDKNRLKNFFYHYRNSGYNTLLWEGFHNKRSLITGYLRTSLRYFRKLDFIRAKIVYKAAIALIKFSPSIDFPQK